jgi:uncharacterized protein
VSGTESVCPFLFDRPGESVEGLIDRDQQLAAVADAFERRVDAVVEGPERHGKTSLVNVALATFATQGNHLALRVDCAGVLTIEGFVRRMQDAYAEARVEGSLEEVMIERLDALAFLEDGFAPPAVELEQLLEVAWAVAATVNGRTVVVLDDFQDALTVQPIVDTLHRRHELARDLVSFAFVGTALSGAPSDLWRSDAPVITVGTFDPGLFAAEVTRRFAAGGRDAGEAARAISVVGAGHPQRSSLLAHELWELTPKGSRATIATARVAIDNALVRCTPEFEIGWNALYANERRVAVALANGIAPYGPRAQRATGLAGAGAAQRAMQGIQSSGVVQGDGNQIRLTDPLFAEWLRRRYPQAPSEPGWEALRRRAELRRGGISRGM